jgi:hypothetical protein
MHFIAIKLGFMSTDNRKDIVIIKKLLNGFFSIKIRASSDFVHFIETIRLAFVAFYWIGPKNVAKRALFWRFLESVNALYVVQLSVKHH